MFGSRFLTIEGFRTEYLAGFFQELLFKYVTTMNRWEGIVGQILW